MLSVNAKYSMIVPEPSMILVQLRIIRSDLSRTHYINLSHIKQVKKKQQKLRVTDRNHHKSEASAAVAYHSGQTGSRHGECWTQGGSWVSLIML